MTETILACLTGALRWYAVAFVLALPAAPLLLAALPPTVGWGVARCLGPQLICWVALLPAVFGGTTSFTPLRLVLAALVTLVVSTLLAALITGPKRWHRSRPDGRSFLNFLALEGLLLGSFLFLAGLVSFCVSFAGKEDVTNAGYFIGVLRQQIFPIDDPALAGFALHRPIFGFYSKAAVAFFTGLTPLDSYRIAVAATASAQLAGFALFLRAFNWKWRSSALGALVLGCGSSFESLLRAGSLFLWGKPYFTGQVAGPHYVDHSEGGFLTSHFLWGSLDSQALSAAVDPLFFCVCALVLFSPVVEHKRRDWVLVCLGGLMAAWARGSNIWAVPLYLALPAVCFLATYRMRSYRQTLLLVLSYAVVFFLAWQPLVALEQTVSNAFAWGMARTPIMAFFRKWEIFLLPLQIWLLAKLFTPDWKRYLAPLILVIVSVVLNDAVWMIAGFLVLSGIEMRAVELKVRACFALTFTVMAMLVAMEFAGLSGRPPILNALIWNLWSVAMLVLVVEKVSTLPRWRWMAWALCAGMLFPYYLVFDAKGSFIEQDTRSGLARIAAQSKEDAVLVEWMQDRSLFGVVLEARCDYFDPWVPSRFSSLTGLRSYLACLSPVDALTSGAQQPERSRRSAWQKSLEDGSWYGGGDTCETLKKVLGLKKIDYVVLGWVERKRFSSSFRSAVERCLTPVHEEDLFARAEHLSR